MINSADIPRKPGISFASTVPGFFFFFFSQWPFQLDTQKIRKAGAKIVTHHVPNVSNGPMWPVVPSRTNEVIGGGGCLCNCCLFLSLSISPPEIIISVSNPTFNLVKDEPEFVLMALAAVVGGYHEPR